MVNKIYFYACALSVVFLSGCANVGNDSGAPIPEVDFPKISGRPKQFENCSEVESYLKRSQAIWQREEGRYKEWLRRSSISGYAGGDLPSSVPASNESITNLQERDVDEGDKVKVGPHHIFVAQKTVVQVIDRTEKKLVGVLNLGNMTASELHSVQGHLIVIGRRSAENGVVARFYLAKDDGLPIFVEEKTFTGDLVGTRIIGSRLFLVLQNRNLNSITSSGTGVFGVSCANLFGPSFADFDLRLTSVFSLDFTQPDFDLHSTAFIGGGDHLYVSQHSLYIVKEGLQWFFWDPREDFKRLRQQTIVTRIEFDSDSGQVSTQGIGVITGHLRNRLAMKEFEETQSLSLATTYQDSENRNVNRVWLLDLTSDHGWMKVRSRSEEFGRNEDIRSVRFIGSHAYAVTFEKTDPLFVFDLSNPDRVELKSELKIPGFSSYLHEVGGAGLLGVGYETIDMGSFSLAQGVQISLFDIANPAQVFVLQQTGYGVRGSYLPVTDDPHAFYYDRSRDRAAIPVMLQYGLPWENLPSAPNQVSSGPEYRSGALFLELKQGLRTEVLLSHFDLIPQACRPLQTASRWWQGAYSESLDIDRVFDLDDSLVSVSQFGLRFRNMDDPRKVEKEIVFDRADETCRSLVGRWYDSSGGL